MTGYYIAQGPVNKKNRIKFIFIFIVIYELIKYF